MGVMLKGETNNKEKKEKPYKLRLINEVETAPEKPEIIQHDPKEKKAMNKFENRQTRETAFKDRLNDTGQVILKPRELPKREVRERKKYPVVGSKVKVKFDGKFYPGTVRKITQLGYKIDFEDGKNQNDNFKKEEVFLI